MGEDREREAKIAAEEVPSTDAMFKSENGVEWSGLAVLGFLTFNSLLTLISIGSLRCDPADKKIDYSIATICFVVSAYLSSL